MKPAAVLGAVLGLGLLSAPVPGAEAPKGDVADHVNRAVELMLGAQPTQAQTRQGFLHLLDALLLVAPEPRAGAKWPAKVTEARRLIDGGSLVDPHALALLRDGYRETHGDAEFEMPAGVRSIADARDYCRRLLVSVPGLTERGATGEAARRLLETAVAIVTPRHQ